MDNEIYKVYVVRPTKHSSSTHPAGRFMLQDGQVHILEDYHGVIGRIIPEGPLDDRAQARIASMLRNPYLKVVPYSQEVSGQRIEHVPPADLPDPSLPHQPVGAGIPDAPRLPPVFEYLRAGMDRPHLVEFSPQGATLDGNPLAQQDLVTMMANVHKGVASLRHRRPVMADVAKMEGAFTTLSKAMSSEEAFGHLRNAVQSKELHPDVEDALRRLVYEDPMTAPNEEERAKGSKAVGNQRAWKEFSATPRQGGVYVSMDGNDMKSINDVHGHDAGDHAIHTFGRAASEAMGESVGHDQGKLYRKGGDEFVAHVPSHTHAAQFARALRGRLDQVPPINGVHRLSMSLGFGHDFPTADRALYEAKKAKTSFPKGQAPTVAHSMIPGQEGPVPVSSEFAGVKPQPAPEPAPNLQQNLQTLRRP